MIEALTEYARRNRLVVEPGFSTKNVRWLASINQEGTITSLELVNPMKRRESRFTACPDLQQPELKSLPAILRAWGYPIQSAAHFLVDSCQTVALHSLGPTVSEKTLYKHETFELLIALAATEVQALQPLSLVLENSGGQLETLRGLLRQAQARDTDLISFVIDRQVILERDVWHDWWRNFRRQIAGGRETRIALIHPKLTRLGVGALSFGAPLISFDKLAFESYGLKKSENCAMSAETASAYRAALEHLLLTAQKIAGSKVVYWYDADHPTRIDPLATLLALDHREPLPLLGDIQVQRMAFHSEQVADSIAVRYHLMVMRGADGRARVQLYHSGRLVDALDGLAIWLEQSAMIGVDGLTLELHSLPQLIESFERTASKSKRKSSRDASDEAQKQKTVSAKSGALMMLLQAILEPRTNVSESLVAQVITKIQGSAGNREFAKALDRDAGYSPLRTALLAHLGLLKTWLIRSGDSRLKATLEPDHAQPSYQTGRFAAMLENVRIIAEDKPSGITMHRDFARLITDPTLLLEQCARKIHRDLRRIAARRPWLAISLEQRLEQAWQALQGVIPPHGEARDRAYFTLGYYQQTVFDNIKRDGSRPRDDPFAAPELEEDEFDAMIGDNFVLEHNDGVCHNAD